MRFKIILGLTAKLVAHARKSTQAKDKIGVRLVTHCRTRFNSRVTSVAKVFLSNRFLTVFNMFF